MVLLSGLNYDYSGQITTELNSSVNKGNTGLVLISTEGLTADDYIVIEPKTYKAEIVKISSVTDSTTLVISTTNFAHSKGSKIFRIPYNQIRFYESATADGTYSLIADSTIDMNYTQNTTNFSGGTADYYYKRTFYNETTTDESAIDDAEYWQTDDESLYVTADEMRTFLQFGPNDYPNQNDMRFFIRTAMKKIAIDIDSSDTNILFISTLLLGKSFVMRALATKSVSKGYVQVNAEGRTITKAYQELVLEAENTLQEYKEFIMNTTRREATSTQFLDDTSVIDSWTRQDIINILNGVSDGEDFQRTYDMSFYWSRR